jgi:cytochrome c2
MQMVPGTRMVVGLPNPEARQAVIAYLQQLK